MENDYTSYKDFRFPSPERLTNKKEIDFLFKKGASFFIYPFHVFIARTPDVDAPVRVLTTVSKRKFRKAVDRNHLKRLMREAYRLNSNELKQQCHGDSDALMIAMVYAGGKKLDSKSVHNKICEVIQRLRSLQIHELPIFELKNNHHEDIQK